MLFHSSIYFLLFLKKKVYFFLSLHLSFFLAVYDLSRIFYRKLNKWDSCRYLSFTMCVLECLWSASVSIKINTMSRICSCLRLAIMSYTCRKICSKWLTTKESGYFEIPTQFIVWNTSDQMGTACVAETHWHSYDTSLNTVHWCYSNNTWHFFGNFLPPPPGPPLPPQWHFILKKPWLIRL